ncbi:hypothetical protein C8R46DRAFT_885327 [Mycena filopes]|nr:hypothetical protein C8R46DRAFT_885327 [Mycena filopes]
MYFQDIEDVGTDVGKTTDADHIHIALKYLDIEDEQLWSQKQVPNAAFKDTIFKLYPGADGDKLYTWHDLREIVRAEQIESPASREEFGQYTRDFQRVADFLKSKNKISSRETDENFMKGIHSDFQLHTRTYLGDSRS